MWIGVWWKGTTSVSLYVLDNNLSNSCIGKSQPKNMCISRTIHQHFFSDFTSFCSPVKEKRKQRRMKKLTMVQWINLNQNNKSVLACRYSVLWEKTDPILLPLVVLWQGGRQTGWVMKYRWILKLLKFPTN